MQFTCFSITSCLNPTVLGWQKCHLKYLCLFRTVPISWEVSIVPRGQTGGHVPRRHCQSAHHPIWLSVSSPHKSKGGHPSFQAQKYFSSDYPISFPVPPLRAQDSFHAMLWQENLRPQTLCRHSVYPSSRRTLSNEGRSGNLWAHSECLSHLVYTQSPHASPKSISFWKHVKTTLHFLCFLLSPALSWGSEDRTAHCLNWLSGEGWAKYGTMGRKKVPHK